MSSSSQQSPHPGPYIRMLREYAGVSLDALAEWSGYSVDFLRDLEAGLTESRFEVVNIVVPAIADVQALLTMPMPEAR